MAGETWQKLDARLYSFFPYSPLGTGWVYRASTDSFARLQADLGFRALLLAADDPTRWYGVPNGIGLAWRCKVENVGPLHTRGSDDRDGFCAATGLFIAPSVVAKLVPLSERDVFRRAPHVHEEADALAAP